MTTLLSLAVDAYSFVVLLSVLCSWLNLPPDHPVLKLTGRLVDPVLARIRRVLPSTSGIDFSPMLLLFALRLVKRLVFA